MIDNVKSKQLLKQYIQSAKASGRDNVREVKRLFKTAMLVEQREEQYINYSDEQLSNMTVVLREKLSNGATLDDILVDAFAVCREASKRVLKQRHYLVQIMGGIALHQGRIAEMATGEGKTLTETLPVYLNALAGKGVHVVTVNEYLALRDAEWMGKVFKFLGLTVGAIANRQQPKVKKHAYNCDVTYGTNNEFGFDYLRDNMAKHIDNKVQRPLNYVVIDEVDSILIDEARTPLIISGPSGKSSEMYKTVNSFVATLKGSTNVDVEGDLLEGEEDYNGDYVVNSKYKTVRITDNGVAKAERYFNLDNLADIDNTDLNHFINNALRAIAIMKRDNDYIVEKGEVVIVDEHTGRKMVGRRYSNGLHQAIEAKERVNIKQEDRTLATVTFQNYFKLYTKMSGMTGTAKTEEEEFNSIYNIDVVVIPTNLPNVRVDYPDTIYGTKQDKMSAIVKRINEVHATGQPLLIGTANVEASEELSHALSRANIKHNLLNAKNHQREAEIIAQAGRLNAVTIATNMAGRGTDILLGGNADFLAKQDLIKAGYDEEQINQATGYVVVEELQEIRDKYNEAHAKYKQLCDKEHEEVVAVGGLFVLGTERHDSRRIDNQLRGRAGRQGDNGSSEFYVCAEDNMMRVYGPLVSALNMFKQTASEGIQVAFVSKQMEKAQRSVESRYFASRKSVIEYDDVNNRQRKAVYGKRDKILTAPSVHQDIIDLASSYARVVLEEAANGSENMQLWNMDQVNKQLNAQAPSNVLNEFDASNYNSAREVFAAYTDRVKSSIEERASEAADSDDVPFAEAEKYFLLSNIDRLWMDHLDNLDSVKQGVGLQAIGNHKPIDVYKKEAFVLFEGMNETVAHDTIKHLLFAKLKVRPAVTAAPKSDKLTPNSMCPCNSGKLYKDCCGKKKVPLKSEKPLTEKQLEYAKKREERKNK